MSDNITREPYRNAWYKQLQEEVSKMTPHLVPEVENDDNGKILVAGQEGTFGWAQPPKELPVATSADEGKVLMVDANGKYTLGTVQGGSPHYAEVSLGISVE